MVNEGYITVDALSIGDAIHERYITCWFRGAASGAIEDRCSGLEGAKVVVFRGE